MPPGPGHSPPSSPSIASGCAEVGEGERSRGGLGDRRGAGRGWRRPSRPRVGRRRSGGKGRRAVQEREEGAGGGLLACTSDVRSHRRRRAGRQPGFGYRGVGEGGFGYRGVGEGGLGYCGVGEGGRRQPRRWCGRSGRTAPGRAGRGNVSEMSRKCHGPAPGRAGERGGGWAPLPSTVSEVSLKCL